MNARRGAAGDEEEAGGEEGDEGEDFEFVFHGLGLVVSYGVYGGGGARIFSPPRCAGGCRG